METLLNKNVLVAGATGGIGSEVVRLLKSSSANVFVTGRHAERLHEVANACNIPMQQRFIMDATDPRQVESVADAIHAQVAQIDIVINAIGIGIIKPFDALSLDDFGQSLDINLKVPFYLFKSFLPPMMSSKKGLFINMPGVLGKSPMAGASAYCASKYGLTGLTKAIREDLKRTDIRITNVYFGGTDTPFWDNIDLKVRRDAFITAKEAAKSIWFLCQQPGSGVVSEMIIQPFNHQVL